MEGVEVVVFFPNTEPLSLLLLMLWLGEIAVFYHTDPATPKSWSEWEFTLKTVLSSYTTLTASVFSSFTTLTASVF